ncbi:glycosyltransferase family 4 protein [Streptomyces sp. NPDC057445]|uniref:glycosyltransferase family 4 protein n=1 Tax=Streptomyces sp. NPDC057445 TaxID=3346136 RepID=UPI00369B4674
MESHLWDYSRLLAQRGHDVTVLTGTPAATDPGQPGVRVLTHPALDLAEPAPGRGRIPALTEWFRQVLTAYGIQIVHGHNLHHFREAPALGLSALRPELGLALLHTYHSLWREPESLAFAKVCAGWDRHYAVSEFLRAACADALGIETERTYLGIDTAPYETVAPLDTRPRSGTVLLPARLIPDKGAMLALEAVHRIIREERCEFEPRLVLTATRQTVDFHGERIGFRELLEKEIADRGMVHAVDFVEAGVDQMRALYEQSTVVVYPSVFAEPMGLAPLEAMCAARPVVVTRMGGLDEGVDQDGMIGHLVPDRDEEKLAGHIARLLDDRVAAREMGLRGRKHVKTHFDQRAIYLARMEQAYGELLSRGVGAPAAG